MAIHIKHPGLLHKHLHMDPKKPIPIATLHAKLAAAKRSGNTELEKELVFTINQHHFHHNKT